LRIQLKKVINNQSNIYLSGKEVKKGRNEKTHSEIPKAYFSISTNEKEDEPVVKELLFKQKSFKNLEVIVNLKCLTYFRKKVRTFPFQV